MATETTRVWSTQQEAIFRWFEQDIDDNLVVIARAGTGKTTTIIEGVNRAPEQAILLAAFNKKIADELATRITNPHAHAKTLHAIGFGIVRRYKPTVRVLNGTERADMLTQAVVPTAPDAIKTLVSKLHTKGREIAPHSKQYGDLTDLAVRFECEPDEEWEADGYDAEFVERGALAAMEYAATHYEAIDYSDMIFLPVRNRWISKQYDLVVVDEAQDMTVAQLEIAQGVCRGRICLVGDNKQAIYGFRGADSNSLQRLKTELNARELKLTTTYRCGTTIVDEARVYVPDFEAGPHNPAGDVAYLDRTKLVESAQLGDFILSRVNAPLVPLAMQLLRSGKRARIAGRDIGSGLRGLIRRLTKKRRIQTVEDLAAAIRSWEASEVRKWQEAERPARVEAVQDQAAMLLDLIENTESIRDVEDRIDALFTDDGLGQVGVITCSSVHKAKGLEANRVFVLRNTLLRFPDDEETNIFYVAVTRAKQSLVYVTENGYQPEARSPHITV